MQTAEEERQLAEEQARNEWASSEGAGPRAEVYILLLRMSYPCLQSLGVTSLVTKKGSVRGEMPSTLPSLLTACAEVQYMCEQGLQRQISFEEQRGRERLAGMAEDSQRRISEHRQRVQDIAQQGMSRIQHSRDEGVGRITFVQAAAAAAQVRKIATSLP